MPGAVRDFRFAARLLRRNPAFTAASVLTLALGIGANSAIFTVAYAFLLRPFPYRDPARLVSIKAADPKDKTRTFEGTLPRFEFLRDSNRSFESIAVWADDTLNLTSPGEPAQIEIARVSPNFFEMLGVRPELGRSFIGNEGTPGGRPVVIIADSLWRRRFHADPNIAGRTLALDSVPHTIVGVLPADVQFPFAGDVEVWTPRYFEYSLMPTDRLRQGVGYLSYLGRLRPNTTFLRADAELAVLSDGYRKRNPGLPDADPAMLMRTQPLRDLVVADVRTKVLLISAGVALLLLIACANVASLMLSRIFARRKEFALRAAVGATRGAIVRQLLSECLLLAVIAGLVGALLSEGATRALIRWGATELPPGVPIGINFEVVAFTLAVSLIAGVLFGVLPAIEIARADLSVTLREEGGGLSAARSRRRAGNLLVVAQIALSLLLLTGAGLLVRSFVQLARVNPGFDAHNVLTVNLSLPTTRYAKSEQQIEFFDNLVRRVSVLPGVRSVAISAALPLTYIRMTPVLPEGLAEVPLARRPLVDIEAISSGWFRTMRVPILTGRAFTAFDDANAAKVVIVNQTFARRFWPGVSPVGKHVRVGRWEPVEVVGLSADVKNNGLAQDTQAQLYLPFPQLPWNEMNLLIRTGVEPHSVVKELQKEVEQVDSEQPLSSIRTMDELLNQSHSRPEFAMLLISAFSFTALVLAANGIYGLLAYSVAMRRREFGIRMALGAGRADILRLVLLQGAALTVSGIGIGLIAAFWLTGLAQTMLFRTGARDPLTFVAAAFLLLLIALAASYIPALRATEADPAASLR